MTVGARLGAYLKATNTPVQEFLDELGVSYESFRKWTAGTTAPNRGRAKRIAEMLGCSTQWVSFGVGDPPPRLLSLNVVSVDHLQTAFSPSGRSSDEPLKHPVGGALKPLKLVETVPVRHNGVPVRGTAVTGENDVVDVSPLEAEPIGWVGALTSEGAYALRVKGDGLWPVIEAESFIVIEPSLPPRNGQKVLIMLRDGRRLIKKLQYATDETVSVTNILTGAPQTFDASEIEVVHSIGSVVEAARFERA